MRRSIRIFLPFFLLLFGFLIFSLGKQSINQKPFSINSGVQSTSENIKIINDETSTPEPTATAFPKKPTPTIADQKDQPIVTTTLSEYPTGDLQIYGPPTKSLFPMDTPVTIYWKWSLDLDESLYFSVYLLGDFAEYLVGTVDEPSLGKLGYQLSFAPFDMIEGPGTYFFEIRLENKEMGNELLTSDQRTLILVE